MHDGAAGWGLQGNKIDSLLDYANTELSSDDFENCYVVDYVLDAQEDNTELLTALASHPEYFGNHIDEVKVVIKNISLQSVMAMGANKDSMKISFNGIDYVRFKDLDFVNAVFGNRAKTLAALVRLNINEWCGRRSVQCFIDDYAFEEDKHRYDF